MVINLTARNLRIVNIPSPAWVGGLVGDVVVVAAASLGVDAFYGGRFSIFWFGGSFHSSGVAVVG